MEEREIYIEAMAALFSDWASGDERYSDDLANDIIDKFAIKDIKARCIVKTICFNMWQMIEVAERVNIEEHTEKVMHAVGLDINCIVDVLLDNWQTLENRIS